MIELYGFTPNLGLEDPSPFVLKVDTYLRMAKIEYRKISKLSNLKHAPKGKLPYIRDNDKIIADSQFIFDHLEDKFNRPLDGHLSAEQKAIAYLTTKSLDENLYFAIVYSRWQDEESWAKVKKAFFGKLPFPLNAIVPIIARKQVIRTLYGQGVSRHTKDEIISICQKTYQALTDLIGDKPFVFGDRPCSLDATLFGFLAEVILADLDNTFNESARNYPVLVKYCQRIYKQYYS
ncbi:glutathione S-transferase family protein [Aliikangiella sp. G2MR2-5]|uniref:glutathione S-transferase family protein n=1 Tax=Aliikangiella sp. G2MR2-5 TaxID=2788943 RepID=UPI0018A94534|nr:glutathione S-transferase family protein [Aliikangiella sp. G2MR2-5]